MLSVVVYGRNDAHGYNLHKRVALSLNCIAEMLTDAEDEIVFVDYNTADELPTCPEAIHDTLTVPARQKLKILRARPAFHAAFLAKTHIPVLEPQARNIGIRRTNPKNRWVLSTNTDMIFVPQSGYGSLTELTGSLPDGFYHLPRFELPESLWEVLDRGDPGRVIATVGEWGRRFHLNEVVYGGFDNLYEAPGDFQLFLREDLFEVCGFDEEMILGWHVDSNIARRMKLFRGEVKTAVDRVFGYHCGHTRQSTIYHGSSSTSNSIQKFVIDAIDPICRGQSRSWGAPDIDIEEIRLQPEHWARFASGLIEAIPCGGPIFSEASLHPSTYCEIGFDAEHVLPHLGSLLYELPARQKIFYCGDNLSLITGLRRWLEKIGRASRLILPIVESVPLIDQSGIADSEKYDWLDLDEALECADIIILQNPSAGMVPTERRRTCEWFCQHVLERVTALERRRPAVSRRRLIVINATHTLLQDMVNESVSFTAMPYITRLRHGFVVDQKNAPHPAIPSDPALQRLYKRLGRQFAFSTDELDLLGKTLKSIRDNPSDTAGWGRLAREAAMIAAEPTVALHDVGLAERDLRTIIDRAGRTMAERLSLCAEPAVPVGPRPTIGTRICSGSDWEDQDWRAVSHRYFGGSCSYSIEQRSRWVWERVTLLYGLATNVPRSLRPWVLVLAQEPDALPLFTAHHGYRVVYATTAELCGGAATDWASSLTAWNVLAPAELLALDRLQGGVGSATPQFAAVLALAGSLFSADADRAAALFAALEPMLEPGAYLGASVVVHLNDGTYDGALSFAEWRQLLTPHGLLGSRGLSAVKHVDHRIPLDTAVRFAQDDTAEPVSGLSFGYGDAFVSIAATAARWPGEPITEPLTGNQSNSAERCEMDASPHRNSAPIAVLSGLNREISNGAAEHIPSVELVSSHSPRCSYRIGLLNPGYNTAENEYAASLRIAAERMGHQLVPVTGPSEILTASLDFVLAIGSAQPKMSEIPTFGVINDPRAQFCAEETDFYNLVTYDGYLTIADSVDGFLKALCAGLRRRPYVGFCRSTPERQLISAEIKEIIRLGALRLCCLATECAPRAQVLFRELAQRAYTRIYGPADCWQFLKGSGYFGTAASEGESIRTIYASFGAGLVVLPPQYLIEDMVSDQIFEISAVGAVAICPDIPWVRENFGDAVFYYDAFGSSEVIVEQIDRAMATIESNPDEAVARAASAKAIFDGRFAAEVMLHNAVCNFEQWREGEGRPSDPMGDPLIDVVICISRRPAAVIARALRCVEAQSAGRFRIIFVCSSPMDVSEFTDGSWQRIAGFEIVNSMSDDRAAALAAGLGAVRNEYFAVLDEDLWLPGHIAGMLREIERASPDRGCALSGYVITGDADSDNASHEGRQGGVVAVPGRITLDSLLSNAPPHRWLASSALLGCIDPGPVEDWELVARIIASGDVIFSHRATVWSARERLPDSDSSAEMMDEEIALRMVRILPLVDRIEAKIATAAASGWPRLAPAFARVESDKAGLFAENAPFRPASVSGNDSRAD